MATGSSGRGEEWEASPKTLICGGELCSTRKRGGERQWETLASPETAAEVDHVAVNRPGWAVFSSPGRLSVKPRPFLVKKLCGWSVSAAFDSFDGTLSPS